MIYFAIKFKAYIPCLFKKHNRKKIGFRHPVRK